MAGRRPQPPDSVAVLTVGDSGDPKVDRQFVQIQQAVQDLQVKARADATAIAALQASGGGGGGVTDGDKGDVTVSGGGTVWTVDALPESRITGLVADLAARPLTSSLDDVAFSGSAADLQTGTLAAGRMPALTGDVTTSSGSVATTIASGAVTNAKLANMAAATLKGSIGGGAPADLTAVQAKGVLAIAAGDVSGLAAIATSGSASDLGSGTVPAGRMPALTGDVTTSAGTVATTIAAHVVTYAKEAQAAANTLVGNNTGSTADKQDLTVAQVLAMLVTSTGLHLHDLGDGSDGTPDLDGTNTFTWASKSGSTYTLTRSVFWAGATIRSGVTIKPDGWIIRSNALIDDQAGSDINTNGIAATTSTGAAAPWTSSARELVSGLAGANAGNAGGTSITAPQVFSTAAATGGAGGIGAGATGGNGNIGGTGHGSGGGGAGGTAGGGTGNAGRDGGAVTLNTVGGHVIEYEIATSSRLRTGTQMSHQSGAGGGGNGVTANSGGAGGSGAGWMSVIAHSITGAGTWRAIGGAGANGAAGGAGTNGQGGGAGGTGGIICIHVAIGAFPAAGTSVQVTGGAGGTGGAGAGGGGAGGNGATGGVGYYIKI